MNSYLRAGRLLDIKELNEKEYLMAEKLVSILEKVSSYSNQYQEKDIKSFILKLRQMNIEVFEKYADLILTLLELPKEGLEIKVKEIDNNLEINSISTKVKEFVIVSIINLCNGINSKSNQNKFKMLCNCDKEELIKVLEDLSNNEADESLFTSYYEWIERSYDYPLIYEILLKEKDDLVEKIMAQTINKINSIVEKEENEYRAYVCTVIAKIQNNKLKMSLNSPKLKAFNDA